MKSVEAYYPDYYESFFCKCGECRTPCCDGWGITVSRDEYFRLIGLECSEEMRHKLDCAFTLRRTPDPEAFAQIHPNYLGDCPMLAPDGLCALQKECGEEALPLICRLYPRSIRRVGGRIEICISNSCEKTVELLFSSEQPFTVRKGTVTLPFEGLKLYDPDPGKDALRDRAIGIMNEYSTPIGERIAAIGREICGVDIPAHEGIASAVTGTKNLLIALEKHSSALLGAAVRTLGRLSDADPGTVGKRFLEDAKRLDAIDPALEIHISRLIANHMYFETFPFVSGLESKEDAFGAFCSACALLRCFCVCVAADGGDADELTDTLAAAFRFLEHTDFYALGSYGSHPAPSQVWAKLGAIFGE